MSVGKTLQDRRVALGWRTADLAASLRIQPTYLEAIEAEDFKALPGGAYTIGFVRTYARALGEDEEAIVAVFRREQADALHVAPLRIRSPIVESRVPTASLVVLAVLAALAVWTGWAYLGRAHLTAAIDTVPAVPERLAPVTEQPQPAVAAPVAAAAAAPQPAPAAPPAPAATPPAPDSDEARNDTDQPEQLSGVRTAPANQDTGTGAVLGSQTSPSRVEIHTSEDSWVQIRDAAHNPIFTGVMHAGDVYKLPNAPGYSFTAGNAGAVTLVVDGVAGPAMGTQGQVLRNVAIPAVNVARKP